MPDLASPTCPKCHNRRTARVKRVGFLQTVIFPYLHLYPWECSGCRSVFTFKNRGQGKRRERAIDEAELTSTVSNSAPLQR